MAETNVEKLQRERREAEVVRAKQEKEDNELFSYDSLVEMTQWNKALIRVMHRSVAKDTTMAEFAYFLNYCKSLGLNPIEKEVWCYRDHKNNIITFAGKDGFLKLAKKDPLYKGLQSAYVCENDYFGIDIPNGNVVHTFEHKDRGEVVGAWAKVLSRDKDQREDTVIWVPFDEFNKNQSTWNSNPTEMIKKTAECHALKNFVGIPGLQNEYEWKVKDNVVSHVTELPSSSEKPKQEQKEEQRLQLMIENAKDLESLKKVMSHCQTPELVEAYNNKKEELKSGTIKQEND